MMPENAWTPENAPRLARRNLKDFVKECRNGLVLTLKFQPGLPWRNEYSQPYVNIMTGIVGEQSIYHLPQGTSVARVETTKSIQASSRVVPGLPFDSPIIGPLIVPGNLPGRAPLPLSPNLMTVYDDVLVNWRGLEKDQTASLSIAGAGVREFLKDLRSHAEITNCFIQIAELGEVAVAQTLAQTAQ